MRRTKEFVHEHLRTMISLAYFQIDNKIVKHSGLWNFDSR